MYVSILMKNGTVHYFKDPSLTLGELYLIVNLIDFPECQNTFKLPWKQLGTAPQTTVADVSIYPTSEYESTTPDLIDDLMTEIQKHLLIG